MQQLPKLLTIQETCEALTVSRATLYRIMRRGELQTVRVGKRPRIERPALAAYLRRSRSQQQMGA